jgi:PST family polysaccharide transporter
MLQSVVSDNELRLLWSLKFMSMSATKEPSSEAPAVSTSVNGSHKQILKSSAMVGGSQVVNVAVGIIRTKAMAVLLGPAGFGLFGLYTSVSNLAQTLADMGIFGSGVRQIAAAVSTGDDARVWQTVVVLRRISIVLGLIGIAVMITFSRQISSLTFGNESHQSAICWLSLGVFFALISSSQGALIQGMRRIADLARMQIFGAISGAISAIVLVYLFRERGVVASIVCVSAMSICVSWWFARKAAAKIRSRTIAKIDFSFVMEEVGALLKLGLAFMVSSLVTLGVAYVVRITLLYKLGMSATGIYQSAWTLGGMYVGFILQAMGADFYPRLTEHAHDNEACNRLVNEQTYVGLLLAAPGVLATLTFAPLVVSLFYSAKFVPAVTVLRWVCLGTMLQVVSWPMGFVIMAKARRGLLILCEVSWGLVSVALAWVCISAWGLAGAGFAFFASYIFHGIMLYTIVSRLSGFRWSSQSWKSSLLSISLASIAFGGFSILPLYGAVALGCVTVAICGVFSIRALIELIDHNTVPGPIRKLDKLVRMISKRSIA